MTLVVRVLRKVICLHGIEVILIKEGLYKAIVNMQWHIRFEEASIFYLPHLESDHALSLWNDEIGLLLR